MPTDTALQTDTTYQPDSGLPSEAGLTVPMNEADHTLAVRHGIRIADWPLLIPLGLHAELISRPPICPIPDTPPLLMGFINHRGHTTPLFDLEQLARADAPGEGRWVLLLGEEGERIGLLLNRFPQGLSEPEPSDEAVPEVINALVSGSCTVNGSLWYRFDPERFNAAIRALLDPSAALPVSESPSEQITTDEPTE